MPLRRLLLVAVAACHGSSAATPQSPSAAAPDPPTLYVCIADDVPDIDGRAMPFALASIETFGKLAYDDAHQFTITPLHASSCATPGSDCDHWQHCRLDAVDACYGDRGAVYCNLAALARIEIAVAIAIGGSITARSKPGEMVFPIDVFAARDLLDGMERKSADNGASFNARWNRIEASSGMKLDVASAAIVMFELIAPQTAPEGDRREPRAIAARMLEARALMDVYGFVIGHELAHAWGACPIETPSLVETSGMFDAVVNLQTKGSLCPSPISIDELEADRCALRTVTTLEQELTAGDPPMKNPRDLRGVSRLLAAQAVDWILIVGLGTSSHSAVSYSDDAAMQVRVQPRSGYLYAPLRLALYATLLRQLEDISFVGACNQVGAHILSILLTAVQCGPEDTRLTRWATAGDAVGHYFPANSAIHRRPDTAELQKQPDPIAYMTVCE